MQAYFILRELSMEELYIVIIEKCNIREFLLFIKEKVFVRAVIYAGYRDDAGNIAEENSIVF